MTSFATITIHNTVIKFEQHTVHFYRKVTSQPKARSANWFHRPIQRVPSIARAASRLSYND